MADKRSFEFVEGTSNKFWEIWIEGPNVVTRYGKIGSAGQTTTKAEGSGEKARKLYARLVREKTSKGYVEKQNSEAAGSGPAHAAPASVAARPGTSTGELVTFFSNLGLAIELRGDASAEFDAVFGEVMAWYSDAARAASARVFALRHRDDASAEEVYSSELFGDFRDVLARWLNRPLPALEGEQLIGYVADSLMIDASHSQAPAEVPQLLALEESPGGTLYLLRSDVECGDARSAGRLSTLNSPDTEAAMSGIFRFEGCTRAFGDHAGSCPRCLAALEACELKHGLPEGFEKFRRHPVRPPPPALPPLPPVSGVGIVIPRPTKAASPPMMDDSKKEPWWKL